MPTKVEIAALPETMMAGIVQVSLAFDPKHKESPVGEPAQVGVLLNNLECLLAPPLETGLRPQIDVSICLNSVVHWPPKGWLRKTWTR